MNVCPEEQALTDRHITAHNAMNQQDGWEAAMTLRAATDQAWDALCEHRATCWRCAVPYSFQNLSTSPSVVG